MLRLGYSGPIHPEQAPSPPPPPKKKKEKRTRQESPAGAEEADSLQLEIEDTQARFGVCSAAGIL